MFLYKPRGTQSHPTNPALILLRRVILPQEGAGASDVCASSASPRVFRVNCGGSIQILYLQLLKKQKQITMKCCNPHDKKPPPTVSNNL